MARNYSAGSASVDISPNFDDFVIKLRAHLEAVDAEIAIPVIADTARALADIERFRAEEAGRDLTIKVDVDTDGAAAKVAKAGEEAAKQYQEKLGEGTEKAARRAQTALDSIDASSLEKIVRGSDDAGEALSKLNRWQLDSLIGEVNRAGRSLGTEIPEGASDAERAIRQLDSQTLEKLLLQARAVRQELDKVSGSAKSVDTGKGVDATGLKTALAKLPSSALVNAGALGIGNLPAAATALASVATSVQQVSQAGLVLPGVFAGAGAAISTLVVGMQGMKDAFGDDPKKAAAAYGEMASSAQQVVMATKGADAQVKSLEKTVQGTLFEGVAAPLKQTISNDIPVLEKGMKGVAGSFNTGIKTALTELGNDKSQSALSTIFANTAGGADKLNGSIVPIIDSIRILTTEGSKFLPEFGQGITNLATRLDGYLQKSQQTGELAQHMREGIDAVKTLGSILGNLGSALSTVLKASKGDGDGLLVTVDHLTERMAVWLKSTEGQDKLTAFFREGKGELKDWEPILEQLPSLLHSVYEATSTWSGITMPFLQAAAKLLGDHPQLVRDALIAYLAFKTVGPIFDLAKGSIEAAGGALSIYKKGAAEAADGGAGKLKSAMGGVSTLIGSALGGPWGLAIGAATVGLGILATKHQEAADKAAAQDRALKTLGQTLDEQSGLATEATRKSTAKYLEEGGYLQRAQTLGVNTQDLVSGASGLDDAAKGRVNQQLTKAITDDFKKNDFYQQQVAPLATLNGLSDTDVAQALQGIPAALDKYRKNQGGLPDLAQLKNDLSDAGESAATLGGELNNTNSKLGEMGESNRRTAAALGTTNVITKQGADAFRGMGIAIEDVTALDGRTVMVKTPTDEQKKQLADLGTIVQTLPDGSVKIVLDDAKAKTDIANITKPETKNVTVSVQNPALAYQFLTTPGVTGPGAPAVLPAQPKATGGALSGGIPGVDSIPILGMDGEHMLDRGDVERMGGQSGVYRFRAALKAGLVRGMASGGAVGWTNDDEQQLQQAIAAQQKAQKDQSDNLTFKKDITDQDKRDLQQKVDSAHQKVTELQQKKNSGGITPAKELPQVGAPSYKSKHQIDIENAQIGVDEANTKRNQVYSNPNSSDNDKRRADNDYLTSQRSLRSAQKEKDDKDKLPDEYSVPGIAAAAGGILGTGILSFFGLENSVLAGSNPYNKAFNAITKFYGDKDKEAADEADDTNTGYAPQNLPVEDQAASQGGLYTGQTGYQTYASGNGNYTGTAAYSASAGVEQWRPTFAAVLSSLGMPASWISLGLAQMNTESSGNPKAINLSDSNAEKGTPSKGLMQVIDPTFASYRSALYPNDVWDPSANIAAALRYTVNRYGGPEGVWGQGHGYADGGWVTGIGGGRADLNRARLGTDEFVVNAVDAVQNGPLLEAINAGLIPKLAPLPQGMTPRGGDSAARSVTRDHSVNFHAPVQVMDMDHLVREQDRWAAIQSQGVLAAY